MYVCMYASQPFRAAAALLSVLVVVLMDAVGHIAFMRTGMQGVSVTVLPDRGVLLLLLSQMSQD
jgi:hypothetical protein